MPSNFTTDDPTYGSVELDEKFVTDSWLVDQFVGNALQSWGSNGNGRLGLNDATNRSSPAQVGAMTNWKQVMGGANHTAAIKTDGTLWSWGWNIMGQLGLGNVTSRSSPVQVGTLTNWKQVGSGSYHTAAISFNDIT